MFFSIYSFCTQSILPRGVVKPRHACSMGKFGLTSVFVTVLSVHGVQSHPDPFCQGSLSFCDASHHGSSSPTLLRGLVAWLKPNQINKIVCRFVVVRLRSELFAVANPWKKVAEFVIKLRTVDFVLTGKQNVPEPSVAEHSCIDWKRLFWRVVKDAMQRVSFVMCRMLFLFLFFIIILFFIIVHLVHTYQRLFRCLYFWHAAPVIP